MSTLPPLKEAVSRKKKKQIILLSLTFLFSLIAALLISLIKLDYVESYLYDLRIRTRPVPRTSNLIELIYINAETIKNLNGSPGAKDQAHLLQLLSIEQPKVIIYDLDFDKVQGSIADKKNWSDNFQKIPYLFGIAKNLAMKGEGDEKLASPLEALPLIPAVKTTDTLNFAKDGVTRRMMLTYQDRRLLQPIVASLINPDISNISNIRGVFNFLETDQAYIDFRPSGTYPSLEFSEVLRGHFEPGRFKNKIVFIGQDLGSSEEEYASTPYNRNPNAMTRIELQSNVVDTLIQNSAPIKSPPWLDQILIAVISMLTVYVVINLKPIRGLAVLGASFVAVCLLGYFAFWPFGLWIDMAHPLLAIFLCYYFFIPYRLIIENRRSWEYFQKNKLLKQVEELKGNFISMMSHDLKTPIARIQGMTDVILTDQVALSSQQREAVDTIRHSSDDLLKFINAILNYGRIESEGVHLQLQSKDVNALIQEVIKKHEFHAKVKHIQIVQELEPLFPLSVDPDLIRQVLSNLVENAIKYSAENTKILISSEERDGKVIVQVADQGFGIPSDELPNIFMKFFRSKNAKSSPIKGSGLGLYLAKYFIELHQGSIFVESSYGQGSTFTVELPIKQGRSHA